MSVIWHKIWFDIWHNKMRTLLAVLSIAAGVFAVGTIFGMSDMLLVNKCVSYGRPAHACLCISGAPHRPGAAWTMSRSTVTALRGCGRPYNPTSAPNRVYRRNPGRYSLPAEAVTRSIWREAGVATLDNDSLISEDMGYAGKLRHYVTSTGVDPFQDWIDGLNSSTGMDSTRETQNFRRNIPS